MTYVGEMKQSPLSFYEMTIREVSLAIEGHNNALERDYHLQFLAAYNAQGLINGGKKFKAIDPFEKAEEKHIPTREERDKVFEFLNSQIKEV